MHPVPTNTAMQYEIKIYDGLNDAVTGGGQMFQEIFIPSHKLIVNSKGDMFYAEHPRNIRSHYFGGPLVEKQLKEIQIPTDLVERIASVVSSKLQVNAKEKELLAELNMNGPFRVNIN